MKNKEFKTVPNFSNYEISKNGIVRDKTTKKIINHTLYGKYVMCQIYNDDKIRKKVQIRRLVAQTYIPNPENKPIVMNKDSDLSNNHVDNLIWRTAQEQNIITASKRPKKPKRKYYQPKRKPSGEKFKTIPGFSNYEISKNGIIRNKISKLEFRGHINHRGYIRVAIINDAGKKRGIGMHMLLGIVYISNPKNKPVINHIDTNPSNNDLKNLEWVTHKENSLHAAKLGLYKSSIPILEKDIDTGIITKYKSITTCADNNKMSTGALQYRLDVGEKRIFPERKQYRYHTKNIKWYTPEDVEQCMLKNSTYKKVLIKNITTGDIKEFDSVTDTAKFLNLAVSTVSVRLKQYPAILPNHIQLKWSWDKRPWVTKLNFYENYNKTNKVRFVKRVNVMNNKEWVYATPMQCAKVHNIKHTTLIYRLKSNGNAIFDDNCTYTYLY